MKQKNKNNSNIVKVLIVLLLISFILYYIDNLKVNIDSYTAEIDILEEKIKTKAVVIKDEKVYFSDYAGNVKYYFEEGDRVKKGALLATIYLNSQASKINEEINVACFLFTVIHNLFFSHKNLSIYSTTKNFYQGSR